ncbi:MAG: efflux RND transporter periplasmic adaptor subunit, partial [Gemmatimonadetes bacterium]|nr:efflux RND transporter periplasmic adaptor subunit [Gemmatimonadota bacterium]
LYSGTVEGREADLGFQVAGRVERILVDEGDVVAAGQVLAVLDTAELAARRAGAVAQVAAARAQLAELERGSRPEEVAQARAAAEAARERLENARRDLERIAALQRKAVVSRQDLDRAELAVEVAQAQDEQARQQLRLVTAGPRPERIEAQRALLRQAEAAVAQLDAALANAVIRAPFPGVVTIRHREPGETLSPGLPVLTVLNPADRWVRIYVPEDRVGRLRLGEPARIASDAFPSRRYAGRVTFIASQAEFTPKNVQTTEERTKLVYAVKVQVTGDPARDLKPGVPADVVLGAP